MNETPCDRRQECSVICDNSLVPSPFLQRKGLLGTIRGVRNRAKSWTQVSEILVEIRDPSRDLKSQAFYCPEIFAKLRKFLVRSAFYPVNYKNLNTISDLLAATAALLFRSELLI